MKGEKEKMKKKLLTFMLACSLAAGQGVMVYPVHAAQSTEDVETTMAESEVAAEQMGESDYSAGTFSDIKVSNVSVTGGNAGGKATIQFTVTGNRNNKKKYDVDAISQVYPVLDGSFPFETNDAAYEIKQGNGSNTLQCSYTFDVKESIDTAYYPISFAVVYGRKSFATGKDEYADKDYSVTKSVNVKLTAKKEVATTEAAEEADDISIQVAKSPSGTYGGNCNMKFTVKSSKCKITSVTPVISETFPFETKGDAYKTIRNNKGTKQLNCNFNYKVRSDVTTGYQTVTYTITYVKNKTTFTTTRSINVQLTGKKEKKQGDGSSKKTSTPRVMVVGYDMDKTKIYPNSEFNLILHVKNNAKVAVSNVKFTLSTANGEFLPVSGASTAFKESIAAGQTIDIPMQLKASASLGSKSYPITVKAEYENSAAESFTAEDSVSIPVQIKDRFTVTEIVAPENLTVGGSEDLSFSINNLGSASLNNVIVSCEGEGFSCEESYVGNIASGATGYASITLNGEEVTPDDSKGECTIKITYENGSGESKTYEEKATVLVMEESMDDMLEGEMDAAMMGEMNSKKTSPVGILIAVIVVAAVVVVIVKKRKKKRLMQEEEELMDDEF